MNFANTESKAWRDIWGSGQGIGAIHDIPSAADLIERLRREYASAIATLV
jgi:nitronate monooxygenase